MIEQKQEILFERLKQEVALRETNETHIQRIISFALSEAITITKHNKQLAEDITQSTLEQLLSSEIDKDEKIQNPLAYISTSVRNVFRNHIRTEKRRVQNETISQQLFPKQSDLSIDKRELVEILRTKLEQKNLAIIEKKMEGKNDTRVAEELGMSIQAVSRRKKTMKEIVIKAIQSLTKVLSIFLFTKF